MTTYDFLTGYYELRAQSPDQETAAGAKARLAHLLARRLRGCVNAKRHRKGSKKKKALAPHSN